MALFLPSNGSSTYGYGGYGLIGYGRTALNNPIEITDAGYGHDNIAGSYDAFPAPPIASVGGYGGYYGKGSYGSRGVDAPRVSSAMALDGNRVEIFFSVDMLSDAEYYKKENYTFSTVIGADISAVSVQLGRKNKIGYSSVIVTHTGTTLGGKYIVSVTNLQDISYHELLTEEAAKASFCGLRPINTVTGTVQDGNVLVEFNEDIIEGATDSSNYVWATNYPINVAIQSIKSVNPRTSNVIVQGMTNTDYTLQVGNPPTILFDANNPPTYTTNGNGSAEIINGGLFLSKEQNDVFSVSFPDQNGKVLPNSSYTVEIQIDLSNPHIRPYYLTQPVCEIFISDGVVEVSLIFKTVSNVRVIEINSGAFSSQVVFDWRTIEQNITLVRNEKYSFYALLINGACLLTTSSATFNGANAHGAGVTVNLNPYYRILLLPLKRVVFTASQTIYTLSGNFIHNTVLNLRGASTAVQEVLLTQHGPLTKGWGNATPATKQDVEVTVNGVTVPVSAVNPYEGAIIPETPIPLMPFGMIDVQIDYKWHKNPIMAFAGLNTEGLTLNKWDRANYLNSTIPNQKQLGKNHIGRFPFGVVLPFGKRNQPKLVSHRYIGFQRDYSAVLNSPTTMKLNQDPHRVSIPELKEMITGELSTLDGNKKPEEKQWDSLSPINTQVIGDGTFRTTGSGMYYQEVGYEFPKSTITAARFQVEDYQLFGVFTGVSFGVKTNDYLYLIGLVEINSVQHVGLLRNLDKPNEEASWLIGLEYEVELTAQNLFKIPTNEYPQVSSTAQVRFQVLNGVQKGVYTVKVATPLSSGETVVEFDPPMPASYKEWGNNPVKINFEHLFSSFNQTYRMVCNTDNQAVELYLGGAVSGLALATTSNTKVIRSEDYFSFSEGVFFGSLGDQNNPTIKWSLFQYGTTPKYALNYSRGIVVAEHFTNLPDNWFVLGDYGKATIEIDQLELKGLGDYEFNRIEPFFKTQVLSDTDFTFRVDEGTIQVVVDDSKRTVIFQNLLWDETGTGQKYLVNLWDETLNGKTSFEDSGWVANSSVNQFNAQYTLMAGSQVLANPPCNYVPPNFTASKNISPNGQGLSIDFRVKQERWEGVLEDFRLCVYQGAYTVCFELGDGEFSLGTDSNVLHVKNLPHLATFHTYRLVLDVVSSSLNVLVDDALVVSLGLAGFSHNAEPKVTITTEQECVLDYLVIQQRPNATVKRTIGVYKQGAFSEINSWEIPRTDSHYLPNNSSLSVIEEMDWREMMDVRIHRDATWGVTVYRTDLPPPPYFDGVFATETTDPSAGWINIEYEDLPSSSRDMGAISFGSSIGYSEWRLFRYRLYQTAVEDMRSPHHMVLNQSKVLTSDEIHNDITIESVEVKSLSNQVLSLIPTNIFAERIFVVRINDVVIPSSMWNFDKNSQTIFFQKKLGFLSGVPHIGKTHEHNGVVMVGEYHTTTPHSVLEIVEHYTASISFNPSRTKRTKSYLQKQDVLSSVTLLNHSTPPIPKSQIADAIREIVFGSGINIVQDVLNIDPDFYLNDPSKSVQFRDPSDAFYENLEFIEKELGEDEPIELACDDFNEIKIKGTSYSEQNKVIKETPQQIGHVFHLSGGNYLGKSLGGTNAVLYPNAPSNQVGGGSVVRQCHAHLKIKSVMKSQVGMNTEIPLEETLPTMSDGGSCNAVMVDYANLHSHIGPWGNMIAMNQNSLLYGTSPSQPTGTPSSGSGMTSMGGSPLPLPTVTTITIP